MPSLSATLDLEAADALAVIDQVEAALAAAVDSVGPALSAALDEATASPLSIEVDAGALTAAVDDAVASASAVVAVEADTADVSGEIEAAVAEAAPPPIVIEADTGDAQSNVDDLAASLTDAGDGANALGAGLAGAGGLAGAAGGDLAGLSGSLSGLGPEFAAVGAAAGGVAVPFQGFINDALTATSRAQRFSAITGELADDVKNLDVGGLSGEFGALSLQLGSSASAARDAAASFFDMGVNSGESGDQVAETTNQIEALALRARARNPAIEVDQAFQGLTRGLARGGRFLAQYGIALTTTEIKQRALANTGKENATDLNQVELAAAGAQLATERLGNTIGSDFQTGLKNSAIQVAAIKREFAAFTTQLGTRALPEFIDTLRDVEPEAEDAAVGIAHLGEIGLKDFDSLVTGVSALTTALGKIPGSAEVAGVALQQDLVNPLAILGALDLGGDNGLFGGGIEMKIPKALGGSFNDVKNAADEAAAAIQEVTQSIDEYLSSTFDVPDAQRDLGQSFADLTDAMKTGTWDDQAQAMEGVVRSAADVIDKQQQQGASQEELNATIFTSVSVLAEMRDAGVITGHQFDVLSGQIKAVPHTSTTVTTAPGAEAAAEQLARMRANVDALNGRTVSIGVALSGVDIAQAQLARLVNPFAESAHAPAVRRPVGTATHIGSTGPTTVNAPVSVTINGDASSSDATAIGNAVGDAVAARLEERHIFIDAQLAG